MSCEFSMVLHSSYSMQKTTWVFFKSWDEFTRHQRMTSAKFSWKTDDFNKKHKKLAVFLSIHEPKLWLWLATSVTNRMCSVEIWRKTRRCVMFFLLRSVVIHHAGHLHSPKNMSNPESMSALTWKPSKSLVRPLCWFPRKSDRMTTVQGRWYMLIGWRQWVA